jgi:hypothetical protein
LYQVGFSFRKVALNQGKVNKKTVHSFVSDHSGRYRLRHRLSRRTRANPNQRPCIGSLADSQLKAIAILIVLHAGLRAIEKEIMKGENPME